MKKKSRTVFFFTFLFVIFGATVCQNSRAEDPTAATLRERAGILRNKISLCQQDISRGARDCYVIVNWENNRKVSISEAISLAEQYLKEAHKIGFDSILNDSNKRAQPIDAPLTNDENNRNAYEYHKVIDQFQVEKSKRYQKDTGTYCNIFVWDVTRAMVGAEEEIPHWVMGKETDVNQLVGWLSGEGKKRNWIRVDARGAQQKANEGHPTIAVWKNLEGHGHVAIVRPGSIGDPRGNAIAQAGDLVLDATHLTKGFNDPKLRKDVEFWIHE